MKRQQYRRSVNDISVKSSKTQFQSRPFQSQERQATSNSSIQAMSANSSTSFDLTNVLGQPLQAKLTIGQPGDKYEQEADAVAKNVVQRINALGGEAESPSDSLQQNVKDDSLQMKPLLQMNSLADKMTAPSKIESSINRARSGGQPLDPTLQRTMGDAMGADFSNVKIHTDNKADQLNQSLQAKAFATGNQIFFKKGEYNPSSRSGQELIAHELTHVVQQQGISSIAASSIQREYVSEDKDCTFYHSSELGCPPSGYQLAQGGLRKKNPTTSKVIAYHGPRQDMYPDFNEDPSAYSGDIPFGGVKRNGPEVVGSFTVIDMENGTPKQQTGGKGWVDFDHTPVEEYTDENGENKLKRADGLEPGGHRHSGQKAAKAKDLDAYQTYIVAEKANLTL